MFEDIKKSILLYNKIDDKKDEIDKLNKRKSEIKSIISSYDNFSYNISNINRKLSSGSSYLEDGIKGDGIKDNAAELIREKEVNDSEDPMINSAIQALEQEIRDIDKKIKNVNNEIADLKNENKNK